MNKAAKNQRKQRGDLVQMKVTPGAVRVNCAIVERDYGDCMLVNVDLHSKYAEMSAVWRSDDDCPIVVLSATASTRHLDDAHPRTQDTEIEFCEHKGWRVFAYSGPGRYTLSLTLVAPDRMDGGNGA